MSLATWWLFRGVCWACAVCRVHGHWTLVHRCARPRAASSASWRFFTGVHAWPVLFAVFVATWCLLTGVCAGRVLCAVSKATWRLFTGVRAVCCVCSVLATWRFFTAVPSWCVLCAVSMATCRLFTAAHARCFACAPSLAPWRFFTGVRAPCVVCAVFVSTWRLCTDVRAWCLVCAVFMPFLRLFTGVHARVRCPWPLGASSSVCSVRGLFALVHQCAGLMCCLCHVLGLLALVCTRLARCVVCCGVLRFCVFPVVPACARSARVPYAVLVWCLFPDVVVIAWPLVLLPWLWPAAFPLARLLAPRCCAVPCRVWSLPVRLSAFHSSWCLPLPGAHAPGLTGRLRIARGGQPRTRLIVPSAGPRCGWGNGLAPHRTHVGPRCGVVRCGSLWGRSQAESVAVFFAC